MFLETVKQVLFNPLFDWLGYVPADEFAAAREELSEALTRVVRIERAIEDRDRELREMGRALNEHKALLATRLSKMAEHLAPLASVRRDPREMQRYVLQVVVEMDVLERMLFDYQIKGSSLDFEFLLDGLFDRLRNDFSVLLRLQKIKN